MFFPLGVIQLSYEKFITPIRQPVGKSLVRSVVVRQIYYCLTKEGWQS
jgi:hypothetical protein